MHTLNFSSIIIRNFELGCACETQGRSCGKVGSAGDRWYFCPVVAHAHDWLEMDSFLLAESLHVTLMVSTNRMRSLNE